MRNPLMVAMVMAALGGAAAAEEPAAVVPVGTASPATGTGRAPYRIGLGDVLRIVVWKEPDVTLDATVRLDGMITMPLIGDVQAAGRAPAELAQGLGKALDRFIESPRVTVSVTQAVSARVYVVGEVLRPGEFPLSGGLTVLKALALAGGFKEFAKREGIVIVRGDQTVIGFNYRRVVDGKDVSQNVLLAPGDTIVVP